MIQGQVLAMGTMVVDGEVLSGIFVECSEEELRRNPPLLYSDVRVSLTPVGEEARHAGG